MKRKYDYIVLGAGRQGTAAAYDLAKNGAARSILLVDCDLDIAKQAKARLKELVPITVNLKAVESAYAPGILSAEKAHACVNALPYHWGVQVAQSSIEGRVPVCDLGCDTPTVKKQLKLSSKAKKAKVAIVPDCGLAPGNSTMFAMYVLERLKGMKAKPKSIKVYCGGLPCAPGRLPLGYKVVYNPMGLLNNYRSKADVVRGGKVSKVESLTELEQVSFRGQPLEAFHTSGGASLLPGKLAKKGVSEFAYKTLRYPGHAAEIRLLRDLGMLDLSDQHVENVWKTVIADKLVRPDVPDVVYLRAEGIGESKRGPARVVLDMKDFQDHRTGFTAMERTTGFAAGLVAYMLASGKIKPGVRTPDDVISPDQYIQALQKKGFQLSEAVEAPV